MSTGSKTAFQPSLERFEGRVVATAGLASAAHHVAAHVEPHHAAPRHPAPRHDAPRHDAHAHPKANHPAPGNPPATTTTTTTTTTTNTTNTTSTTNTGAPMPVSNPTSVFQPPVSNSPSLPTNTTTNQAWVEIVNTTGEPLEYYIKLGPYDNGQFIPFDIGPGQTQYRYSSLISNGERVKADFAIQFGNGPITPLMTGINQASAQGYDIFLDGNLQPYVAPFVTY